MYLQHFADDENIYALYFSVVGLDDIEWIVVKYNLDNWNRQERLSRKEVETNETLTKILWNYDEGPKNMENVHIFKHPPNTHQKPRLVQFLKRYFSPTVIRSLIVSQTAVETL